MDQSRKQGLAELTAEVEGELLSYFRRRLRDDSLARENVQEALLRFAESSYDPRNPDARAILFGIARHLLADHIRRLRKEQGLGLISLGVGEEPPSLPDDSPPEPDRILQSREELNAVMQVLQAMPRRPRQVFVLARMHGLKQREIAEKLGISLSMVEKHMMDATARLLRGVKRDKN